MAQRGGLPRKPLTVMYVSWAFGMGMTAFFGSVANVPQAMAAAFVAEGAISVLVVIWFTAMQRLVPNELLGRVSSLDWMISILEHRSRSWSSARSRPPSAPTPC